MKPDVMPPDQATPPHQINRKLMYLPSLAKAAAIPANNTHPTIRKAPQSNKRRFQWIGIECQS
jgi:hypothetical protein